MAWNWPNARWKSNSAKAEKEHRLNLSIYRATEQNDQIPRHVASEPAPPRRCSRADSAGPAAGQGACPSATPPDNFASLAPWQSLGKKRPRRSGASWVTDNYPRAPRRPRSHAHPGSSCRAMRGAKHLSSCALQMESRPSQLNCRQALSRFSWISWKP